MAPLDLEVLWSKRPCLAFAMSPEHSTASDWLIVDLQEMFAEISDV